MTIGQCVPDTATQLQTYSDAPQLDADRIVLHAVGKRDTSFLLAHANDELTSEQIASITAMVATRKTGKPLAYIVGEADFYGRTFLVTPDVLIPRPDTEDLIEKALEYIQTNFAGRENITVTDIGTGSGIIAITLALEMRGKLPEIHFIASDISEAALKVASKNAETHGVSDMIEFIQGNMLAPLEGRTVDLIVSNPPYVPTQEVLKAGFRQETTGLIFEPRVALDGGEDGMQFVRQIQASRIPAVIETRNGEIIIPTNFGSTTV